MAVEGGWGWWCVFACFLVHALIAGLDKAFSVWYIEIRNILGTNAASTAWLGGLCLSLRLLLGPFAVALINRFSAQKVAMMGSLIWTSGLVLSAFAESYSVLVFTYGVLGGVGATMVFTPSILIVTQYFSKRRSLAMGLATTGSGLGIFAFPPLTSYLLDEYSYFGAMLLTGGIMLHLLPCGALYYAPPDDIEVELLDHENELEVDSYEKKGCDSAVVNRIEVRKNDESVTFEVSCSPGKEDSNTEDNDMIELKERGITTHEVESEKEKPLIRNCSTSNGNEINSNTDRRKMFGCFACFAKVFNKVFDISCLAKDPLLFLVIVATSLYLMGVTPVSMLVIDFSRNKGVSHKSSLFLISLEGITQLIARFSLAFIFNRPALVPWRPTLWTFAILQSGCATMTMSAVHGFAAFAILMVWRGLAVGLISSQQTVVLGDFVAPEILPSAIGVCQMARGIGALMGPYLAGLLKDVTDSYVPSFLAMGAVQIFGAILLFVIAKLRFHRNLIMIE